VQLRHRIFWRVYLHGVALLLAVGIAAGVITSLSEGGPAWRETRHQIHRYVTERLRSLLGDEAALARELALVHGAFGADLALYDGDGRLLAAAGESVPSAEPSRPVLEEVRHVRGGWRWTLPIENGAHLVAETPRRGPGSRLLLVFGVVLLLLAAISLPLVRNVVRPLEQLTDAARRLGAGDLSARSGIDRADEVGELARAFDEMATRLVQLLQTEKELLANVSHELRTPLARIRVALQLAEEAADPEKLRARLAGLGTDLAELESLVEDTLATARLDAVRSDRLPLRQERVALAEIVSRSRERFAELHPQHVLALTLPADLPLLDGDPALLRRALDNLLDNSARYADPDDGEIEVAAEPCGTGVRLEVRDRGIGVDAADLPRLFEPFFRADASRARATGGVGLGLALCRRIVEAHGGTITAERRDGGGLVVRVELPVAPS
jgi:signal transduction histidine kinase